jgi:hypothetical protein
VVWPHEFHRRQICHALGFRECGVADADKLTEWLISNVTQVERGNPAEDLPTDFEDRRGEHYQALRKPLDPSEFIAGLREEMRTELDALHAALPNCDWLTISDRAAGVIKLIPLEAPQSHATCDGSSRPYKPGGAPSR